MPQTASQLASQRERANRDLTDRCEIHRYGSAYDDLGESIKTWAPVATDVHCRVVSTGSVTGRERLRLEAIGQVTQWMIVLPWGTDTSSKDRIYVTSPTPVRTFNVDQVLAPHTDEIRRRAMVDEVN